jgi:hypothetical protein
MDILQLKQIIILIFSHFFMPLFVKILGFYLSTVRVDTGGRNPANRGISPRHAIDAYSAHIDNLLSIMVGFSLRHVIYGLPSVPREPRFPGKVPDNASCGSFKGGQDTRPF